MYDSIEEFSRKWELVPRYKEIKECVDTYNEQIKATVMGYGGDGKVPDSKLGAFNKYTDKMTNTEIKLKHNLKFTKKEVEDSKVKGSSLIPLLPFIQEDPKDGKE